LCLSGFNTFCGSHKENPVSLRNRILYSRSKERNQVTRTWFLPISLVLIAAQALQSRASATFALVHSTLLAAWNKPAASAQIFHDSAFHDFFVEAAQQTVERLTIPQSNRHSKSHPFYL
jgi:hypothetical protein